MKLPALKGGVSKDFSLKSLRMRGNISPTPPVLTALKDGELNPKGFKVTNEPSADFLPIGVF
jgi:hypothetical protein